jgi:hypothetical protein
VKSRPSFEKRRREQQRKQRKEDKAARKRERQQGGPQEADEDSPPQSSPAIALTSTGGVDLFAGVQEVTAPPRNPASPPASNQGSLKDKPQ